MPRTRPLYPPEFRHQTVELVRSGRSMYILENGHSRPPPDRKCRTLISFDVNFAWKRWGKEGLAGLSSRIVRGVRGELMSPPPASVLDVLPPRFLFQMRAQTSVLSECRAMRLASARATC